MSLVSTVGGTDSNSFITSTEANAILADAPFDAGGWLELGETAREKRLELAAVALALLPFGGYRVYQDQALAFPRTCQRITSVIPQEIKEAQAYVAFLVIGPMLSHCAESSSELAAPSVSRASLDGVIDVSFDESSGNRRGSWLHRAILSDDLPIRLKLDRYLTLFRGRGSGNRPAPVKSVE
ncbi:MAG: DnaT-like ssDNA-binding protein [Pseudomonadota bacterium]